MGVYRLVKLVVLLVVASLVYAGQAAAHDTGFLKICKVGLDEATIGQNFTFTFAGQTVTIPAGTESGDLLSSCTQRNPVPVGTIDVTEQVPAGFELVSIRTLPPGRATLAGNVASVTIVADAETTLIVRNRHVENGHLKICKVAADAATLGRSFTFNVAGVGSFTVTAGPSNPLSCTARIPVPPGTVAVTEVVPDGFELVECHTIPPGRVTVNGNVATVTIVEGEETALVCTNKSVPVPGNLQLCKVAGEGIAAGTPFTFTVTIGTNPPQTVTVPAGQCSILLNIPAGTTVTIVETVPAGVTLEAITCDPAAACTIDLAGGKATVVVGAGPGVSVEVSFKNKKTPTQPACTLTKGFFRNHPEAVAEIVAGLGGTLTIGGTALTAAQVQAILDATPGQPGGVTFASNSLLNLTQQLIAALLNLDGAAGPAEVQAAIAAAQAGLAVTVGTGGQISITTSLSQSQIGALTQALSSFNEGAFPGIPHCDS